MILYSDKFAMKILLLSLSTKRYNVGLFASNSYPENENGSKDFATQLKIT